MAYDGGKTQAGTYQKIINQIPPHRVYIEPFLGGGGILRKKRLAKISIGIESDHQVIADHWNDAAQFGVEIYQTDGIVWLRHAFGLDRQSPLPPAPEFRGDRRVADVFIHIDPPYMRGTRKNPEKLYRHEMTDKQHAELLDVAVRLPGPVAISGYRSALYLEKLAGWRMISFTVSTRGGNTAEECLWMNYPAPDRLHDYRYLGNDRRERERVNRRVSTWTAGLRKMPPHERRAILQAIKEQVE